MYINKLFLKEFGKFNNREIKLEQGLNVLYGDEGAGKSTVRDFVTGILFGINKSRGFGSGRVDYSARKPKGGNGYSGKAHVTSAGRNHLLERNFNMTTDGATLTDIENGKSERLRTKNSYRGILFDMDKSTYVDALNVEPADEYGDSDKAVCDFLEKYLHNIRETGCSGINKAAAIQYLENERKKYDNKKYLMQIEELEAQMDELGDVDKDLEDIRKARREELDAYNMEIARLKREARQLVNEKDAEIPDEDEDRERSHIFLEVEAIDDEDEKKEKKKQEKKSKKLTDNIFVIMAVGILVVGLITLAVHLVGFQKSIQQLFVICTIAFVAITIIDGLFRKGAFDGDKLPSEEEFQRTIYEMGRATESRTVRVEIDRVFQEEHDKKLDMFKFQEHDAIEKRDAYYELKEKRDAIFVDYDALETEKKAIDKAIDTINDLSDSLAARFDGVEQSVSQLLGLISDGRYTEVKLDDDMHVAVEKDGHFFRAEFLGNDVVRQVYLAVRLAVAKMLDDEKMPLLLDDVVDASDERQLTGVFKAISTVDTEQVILLTSDSELMKKLEDMRITCNVVTL